MSNLIPTRPAMLVAVLVASAACPSSESRPPSTNPNIAGSAQADAGVPFHHNGKSEQAMPTVRTANDIAPNHGQRINIEATLRRVPLRKGAASHAATALILSDDTQVWVTYGELPPGWERYVDKDVTLEAAIWTGPPPGSKQAVGGPHVSEWSKPAIR